MNKRGENLPNVDEYNQQNFIPNKFLQPNGDITDLKGVIPINPVQKWQQAPYVPNKFLYPNGDIGPLETAPEDIDNGIYFRKAEDAAPVFNTLFADNGYVIKDDIEFKFYYPGNDFLSICLATSPDGITWTPYVSNPIITDGQYHSDVKYYPDGFVGADDGTDPSDATMYYRIWYHGPTNYTLLSLRYAESIDGIVWQNRMPCSEAPTGVPVWTPNTGVSYGIANVVHTPGASNTGIDWEFRMYFNVQWETGEWSARECVLMAFSADGHTLNGYDPNNTGAATPIFGPTLKSGDFDSGHIGWFKVIKRSETDWIAIYSGGTDNTYQNKNGIGYATSKDGINWTRTQTLITTDDDVEWRSKSIWMPSMVQDGFDIIVYFLGSNNPDIANSDWIQWKLGRMILSPDTYPVSAASGMFITPDGKTVTVNNGIITSIITNMA